MKIIYLNEKVNIEIIDRPFGIIASGGADSSLLLYFVMKYTSTPIHIFTCSSTLKGRANSTVISKVVEKCIQLTGNMNIFQHNYYVEEQTKDNLWEYPSLFIKEGKIDVLYSGSTANPPDEIAYSFAEANTENDERDPKKLRSLWNYNNKLYSPFTNINKKDIAEIYKKHDLLESLFTYTRSCEKTEVLNYFDHCGVCWWCEERKWAFGRL